MEKKGNFPLAVHECTVWNKWKIFFSHTTGGLSIGHVTQSRTVAFVASAITNHQFNSINFI